VTVRDAHPTPKQRKFWSSYALGGTQRLAGLTSLAAKGTYGGRMDRTSSRSTMSGPTSKSTRRGLPGLPRSSAT